MAWRRTGDKPFAWIKDEPVRQMTRIKLNDNDKNNVNKVYEKNLRGQISTLKAKQPCQYIFSRFTLWSP